nr:aldo/keto reductase [Arachnia sp.]
LDYVDIFYHHRPDPETPLEETMAALDQAVRSGKALYAGISSYSASLTLRAQEIARDLGTPLVIHQPSYSILNRWVEDGEPNLLQACAQAGMGVIAFSPLAQGMLTGRYLDGIPEGSRATQGKSLSADFLSEDNIGRLRALNAIAESRGQSLAQMALAWVLRDQGDASVTTVLIGASSTAQLDDNLGALGNLEFSAEELAAIDEHSGVEGINLWQGATDSVK